MTTSSTSNSESNSSPSPPALGAEAPAPAGNVATTEPVVIARTISTAVTEVPGVAGISPGIFGRIGTFGVGDVVPGVAVSIQNGALNLEIHVIASLPIVTDLPELAERIRESARQVIDDLPVGQIDVAIDDLQDEPEEEGQLR